MGSSIMGSSIMLLRMAGNAREILPASISSAEAFLPNKTPLPPFGQNCLWWFARMSASENFMRHWEHSIGLCLCSAPKSLRPAISLASLPLSRREEMLRLPLPRDQSPTSSALHPPSFLHFKSDDLSLPTSPLGFLASLGSLAEEYLCNHTQPIDLEAVAH